MGSAAYMYYILGEGWVCVCVHQLWCDMTQLGARMEAGMVGRTQEAGLGGGSCWCTGEEGQKVVVLWIGSAGCGLHWDMSVERGA